MLAALLRGQTSLLPPNALPETLRQLGAADAPAYALVDDPALDTAGLPASWWRGRAGVVPRAHVPLQSLRRLRRRVPADVGLDRRAAAACANAGGRL